MTSLSLLAGRTVAILPITKKIVKPQGEIISALSRENLPSGFLTKRDFNQSPQLQRLARKLNFH